MSLYDNYDLDPDMEREIREDQKYADEMDNYYADVEKRMEEFRIKWPNYCRACGGWGIHGWIETHGFSHGPYEHFQEPCYELPDGSCHRCGLPNMVTEDTPCKNCGWAFDDGMPTP